MDILHRLDFVEPTITHSSPPELTKLGSSRPKRNDTKNLTHGEDQGSIDITAMQQAKKREQTWNIQELQPERSTQYQDKQVHTQQAFYINTTKPTQPHCSEHRSSRAIANSTQNTGRRQQRGKGADSPAPQAQKPLVNHVIPVNASSQIISVRFHGRSFKDAPSLLNHLPSWCCCPNHLP